MEQLRRSVILLPLGLFVLSAGAYWAVLMGVVPVDLDASLVFAMIAGVTALGAVTIGARAPALTAGVGALGFTLAGVSAGGVLGAGDFAVVIGAALATLGVVGYAVSMIHLLGTRVASASPA